MNLKFLKPKKVFKKRNFEPNAEKYWGFILTASFLVILASFIFAFYLFKQVNEEPAPGDVSGTSALKSIKKSRIEKALMHFHGSEAKSLEIINNPSPVVDPSL